MNQLLNSFPARLLCGLSLSLVAWQSVGAQERTDVLVSADWLADNLGNEDLLVVDLAHREKNYNEGHIPGAVFVDWRKDIIDSNRPEMYLMPTADQFGYLMSRLGATPETVFVLTDSLDSRASVRMYLTLRYFGHDRVHVLNGGTGAWTAAGYDVSAEDPPLRSLSGYEVGEIRTEYLTSFQAVRESVEQGTHLIMDGRPAGQYTGADPGKVFHTGKAHQRRGHIASAINVPWTWNFNEDGTFKSPDELRELYADNGVGDETEVVTYCNEGLHATMPWFVLHELLGHTNVQVYEHSLGEWANRDDTNMTCPDSGSDE
ncbi:MAG: sulfurtransferase [Pirellulaceae bacterium]